MAYRIVKYIICGEFWGDEHHCRPPQYKFWGRRVPPSPPRDLRPCIGPVAADGVASSLCRSVSLSRSWAMQNRVGMDSGGPKEPGARWRNLVNAATMCPYIKLLWPLVFITEHVRWCLYVWYSIDRFRGPGRVLVRCVRVCDSVS